MNNRLGGLIDQGHLIPYSPQLPQEATDGTMPVTDATTTRIRFTPALSGKELQREGIRFIIDLSSVRPVKDRLNIDYNHNPDELLGVVSGLTAGESGLEATGEIIPFQPDDRASEVLFRLRAGTPYEVSPTVEFDAADQKELPDGRTETVNGRTFTGPGMVFYNLPIRGISICPYGTDSDTGIGLKFLNKEKCMSEDTTNPVPPEVTPPDPAEAPPESAHPDLEQFIQEFGLELGVEFFRRGISFEEAVQEHYAQLKAAAGKLSEEPSPDTDTAVDEKKKEETTVDNQLAAVLDRLNAKIDRIGAALRAGAEPVSQFPAERDRKKEDNRPAIYRQADRLKKTGLK